MIGVKANALGNIVLALKTTLASLNDVNIATPSNAQQLTYNSTTQKWCNTTPSTFTTALSALTDCSVSSLANDNILYYNSTNSKWQNKNLQESDITNLTSDLSSCEKTANKNAASGYCPLDSNSLVPTANIPTSYIAQVKAKPTIDGSIVLNLSDLNDVFKSTLSNNQGLFITQLMENG